jgi:hypothetical protein
MNEWYDSQKKPNGDFRKLVQERIDKAHPCRTELTKDEQINISKVESYSSATETWASSPAARGVFLRRPSGGFLLRR